MVDLKACASQLYDVVALIPCRDGQENIEQTVHSILNQTVFTFVSVVDDASIDGTPKLLEGLAKTGRVRYVRYPRRENRDYARVPVLLNMALKISPPGRFYLISGDDCTYGAEYCETLIESMKRDKVDVCSGSIGKYSGEVEPSGSGRLVTSSFLMQVTPFPYSIGWETWMLYKAAYLHRKLAVYPVELKHHRKYSVRSTWTFGQSAYVNGVPLLFTLLRTFKNISRGELGPFNSLSILLGQIEYTIRRANKLETAHFVKKVKKQEIKNVIGGFFHGLSCGSCS